MQEMRTINYLAKETDVLNLVIYLIFTWCYCLTILRICNNYMWEVEEGFEFNKMALKLLLFQDYIYINDRLVFMLTFASTPL